MMRNAYDDQGRVFTGACDRGASGCDGGRVNVDGKAFINRKVNRRKSCRMLTVA